MLAIFTGFFFDRGCSIAGMFLDKYVVDFVMNENDRLNIGIIVIALIVGERVLAELSNRVNGYNSWVSAKAFTRHIQMKLVRKSL